MWRGAQPIAGTPAELYLIARGLDPRKLVNDPELAGQWPETLRFTGEWPGMALLVAVNDARTGLVVAVQRIFLKRDGSAVRKTDAWRNVPPGKDKKVKLSLGPIEYNAARFSGWPDPEGRWGLAEGPETALAAQQIHGYPVWASIFAGNMAKIDPPHWARRAFIFANHDRAGQYAGTATRARLTDQPLPAGRPPLLSVKIIQADTLGADAADLLRKGA